MNLDSELYPSDNVLMKSDAASMRYSLELRSPFLDKRIKSASEKEIIYVLGNKKGKKIFETLKKY